MGTWGNKCQTAVHVSLMGVVQVQLRVPTPSPWDIVSPTCGAPALPKVDLQHVPALAFVVPRHPSASWGQRDHLAADVCVCVCVCVCMLCMCMCCVCARACVSMFLKLPQIQLHSHHKYKHKYELKC